jgi:hypothetical protein
MSINNPDNKFSDKQKVTNTNSNSKSRLRFFKPESRSRETYYSDQMRILWLEYGHDPDISDSLIGWRSWEHKK